MELRLYDGPGQAGPGASSAYRELLERLFGLSRSGTEYGLDNIRDVLNRLGNPHLSFETVHVAGSNGKGSTSAFLASILSAHGLKVGLFTSPHLISLTERVQFVEDCRPRQISEDALMKAILQVEAVAPGFGGLSFFEVITAAGMLALGHERVDIAVIEAGLGARLDATSLVEPKVAVLTDLSLEHTEILGETIEEIAREEGAVVRPGRPLVAADGPAAAMAVIDAMAEEARAPLYRIGEAIKIEEQGERLELSRDGQRRVLDGVQLSLLGPHQLRNASLAAQAAWLLAPEILDSTLRRGLAQAEWPGRLEVFEDPTVVLDGAHNAQGAQAHQRAFERFGDRFEAPLHFVFGVLKDKDVRRMLQAIEPLAQRLILTRPSSPRAVPPEALLPMLQGDPQVIEDVAEAFETALRHEGGTVVVCGSLYLVGEVRALLLKQRNLRPFEPE